MNASSPAIWDGTAQLYKCETSGFTYQTPEGVARQYSIAASWRLLHSRVYLELDLVKSSEAEPLTVWRVTNYMGVGENRQVWPWSDFQDSDLFLAADPLATTLQLDAVRTETLTQTDALSFALSEWYEGKIDQTEARKLCEGMTR